MKTTDMACMRSPEMVWTRGQITTLWVVSGFLIVVVLCLAVLAGMNLENRADRDHSHPPSECVIVRTS